MQRWIRACGAPTARAAAFQMVASAPAAVRQARSLPVWWASALGPFPARPVRQRRFGAGDAGGARCMSLDQFNIFEGERDVQRTIVESYKSNGFVVNGVLITGSVLLLPEAVLHWNVNEMKDLTWDSMSVIRVLARKPDVCIVGTGRRLQRLPREVQVKLLELGIHVELMDSINASATFNVLNEEGRVVMAALLPLDPLGDRDLTKKEEPDDDILADMPRPKMRKPKSERR
mmetsp:Transcript_60378/g.148535  ORF Transcript_60378/g.148535 Transcript_60378/m.148535 type:complete len:231 (+) Transcript_60378:201-893(+)